MASTSQLIESLNAYNYGNWSADIKYLLLEKNAWGIVNGTEKVIELDPENPESSRKEVKDFEARSRNASAIIYLNSEPQYRRIIENIDDPKEAWNTLKSHFYPDNRSRHMQLFSDILSCHIEDDEDVGMYASRINRIADQLKGINQPIKEVYLSFQLLRFLPSQFDSIVQSIVRWPEDRFIFRDILSELVSEESRLKLRDADRHPDYEIQAIQRKPKPRQVICFRCKKQGHYGNECTAQRDSPKAQRDSSNARRASSNALRASSNDRRETSNDRRESSNDRRSSSNARRSSTMSRRDYNTGRRNRQQNPDKSIHFITQSNFSELDSNNSWLFDTAASHHFCKDRKLFNNFKPVKNESLAVAVDGITFPILGKGQVKLKLNSKIVTFDNVMYSPKLRRNLISGSRLDTKGIIFKGGDGQVNAVNKNTGKHLFKAKLVKGVYHIYPESNVKKTKKVRFESSVIQKDDMGVWHRRFGHICPEYILNTSKNKSVRGLPNLKNQDLNCEICKLNKHKRVSFKSVNSNRSKCPLDLIYADVWGPQETTGFNGEKYFLSVIDDYSKKVAIYPIKTKSQVCQVLKRHITRAERFIGNKLKSIRTDNGREFVNEEFSKYCRDNGIKHELTNTYTPEQNGLVERYNQTVINGARSVLNESKLGKRLWSEAVLYFTYTWNRICHKGQSRTPFEMYGGYQPSVRHLKPFGTVAYVGIPKQKRYKLDPKAKKGYLVGYAFRTKGYRILVADSNKIIETINVSFNEEVIGVNNHSGAVQEPKNNDYLSNNSSDEYPHTYTRHQPNGDLPDSSSESENDRKSIQPSDKPKSFQRAITEYSSDDDSDSSIPLRKTTWVRKVSRRADGSRNDIYYYEEGKSKRLRTKRDIAKYCKMNKLEYENDLFTFQGRNTYEGIVKSNSRSSPQSILQSNDRDIPDDDLSESSHSDI